MAKALRFIAALTLIAGLAALLIGMNGARFDQIAFGIGIMLSAVFPAAMGEALDYLSRIAARFDQMAER